MRRILFPAVVCAVWGGAWAPPGAAQPHPRIAITSPTHGAALTSTSPFYTEVPEKLIRVTGAVTGISAGFSATYTVLVHGRVTTLTPGAAGTATFLTYIPAGPDPPAAVGAWPSWYPFVGAYADPEWMHLPIIAEIILNSTHEAVSVSRIALVDKRAHEDLQENYLPSAVGQSLAFEITESGVDALEAPHKGSLPYPDKPTFDDQLSANAAGHVETVAPDITHGASDAACLPLSSYFELFSDTQAWNSIQVNANIQYAAYEAARATVEAGQQVGLWSILFPPGSVAAEIAVAAARWYMENACVRTLPQSSDFEICVGEIRGTMTRLELQSVRSIDLSISTSAVPALFADVGLGQLDGSVNGELRSLVLRYSVDPVGGCLDTLRPEQSMDDSEVFSNPGRTAWATCEALEVDSTQSDLTTPLRFEVAIDSDPARLRVDADAGSTFVLSPAPEHRPLVSDRGTCALPELNPYVEDMLNQYYAHIQASANATWDEGAPQTMQANALDALLARLEIGLAQPAHWKPKLYFSALGNPNQLEIQGLWQSDATATIPKVNYTTGWVYPPPGEIPTADQNGLNPFGNPYDISFAITTGALNQVIRELSGSAYLLYNYRPTYAELGPVPPGANPNDRPVLDGTTLQALHPAFAALGATTVTIVVRPTLMPYTWIPPDPYVPPGGPPIPYGRAPLTYQMGQYMVEFWGSQPGPSGSSLWLSVAIDVYDDSFNVNLRSGPNQQFLAIDFGNDVWVNTILSSELTGCPLQPHTQLTVKMQAITCGPQVATAVGNLIRNAIRPRILQMLAQYPEPQWYDVGGLTIEPRKIRQTDKFLDRQVIQIFGEIEP